MSLFEGYMGGDPGQGFSDVSVTNEPQPSVAGGLREGFQDGSPTPPALTTQFALQQTSTSAGSITQFYQPTAPQPQTFSSPQTAYATNSQQLQPQHQFQYQQQSFPYQHIVQQPATTPSNAASQLYQQQPGVLGYAYPQNFAHQQPMQRNQSVLVPQPQLPQTNDGIVSYAARSAQAYATIGSPSPTKTVIPITSGPTAPQPSLSVSNASNYDDSPAVQAQQGRILTDCTRKVQEHAYYMKQAMDKDELSTVLDRASLMVGELGDASSGLLTPKNYYELHMRALDDMPNLEEYFLSLTSATNSHYTMKNLYDFVQYCPRVLSRLYLQISAGSALIRSKEETPKYVLHDLIEAVKCVQNPLRGLFLRHFLLQVTRDKLPDGTEVQVAYEFVLANFIEMNRLWVRIQHLPGDVKSKEQRKKRERERNELRILVGTNLVRLSQLDGVTSQIYGEVILPIILEQITVCGDPLAQAYLMDCIIQVFPDEYHIETLPILLAVCPKLRDKVNVRTIMQSLMDRLANYYADEELLDEADTNEVKKSVARDSFPMFEDCVQKVFHARGPKLVSREVIRLQTALLNFSLNCFPGDMEQVSRCLGVCMDFIRQAANAAAIENQSPQLADAEIKLDHPSIVELQKMLTIPLESLALKVLELSHYSELLQLLPWGSRRDVGMTMLRSMDTSGIAPTNVSEVKQLFRILIPVIRDQQPADGIEAVESVARRNKDKLEGNNLVSRLVHLLDHDNVDVAYEMLLVARSHLREANDTSMELALVPVVFSSLRLMNRIAFRGEETEVPRSEGTTVEGNNAASEGTLNAIANGDGNKSFTSSSSEEPVEGSGEGTVMSPNESEVKTRGDNPVESKGSPSALTCRKVLLFVQATIAMLSKRNPELGVKLLLHTSTAAHNIFNNSLDFDHENALRPVLGELLTQAFALHDEEITDNKVQRRCVVNMVGALLACESLSGRDYEHFITKTAQYAAKATKKQDQCEMVALCSHLFYNIGKEGKSGYKNPQRTLECLQRSLKLADACVSSDPSKVYLFVDLLEYYVYFYQGDNPVITTAYITGLLALTREHLNSVIGLPGLDTHAVADARSQFSAVCEYIDNNKRNVETAERFAQINVSTDA